MIQKIDGIDVNFTGEKPTLIVHNLDQPGHVAEVTSMLAHKCVNVATMQLYRDKRGGYAVMVLETDQSVPQETHHCLCGSFMGKVIAGALQMGESNACMKRIVAVPTAGACGVVPAILVPYYEKEAAERGQEARNRMIEAMYVAAGIGQVIAERASISGAEGGCQAEIGSASAMASGALVY